MPVLNEAPTKLGNVLIEKGFLTPEALQAALARQHREGQGKLLGELLIEEQLCNEDQIVESLAVVYGVPYAKLDQRLYDPKIVEILPRDYIEQNLVLPLFLVRGTLTVA